MNCRGLIHLKLVSYNPLPKSKAFPHSGIQRLVARKWKPRDCKSYSGQSSRGILKSDSTAAGDVH